MRLPRPDAQQLMRQACLTAHDYMLDAMRDIDERLGKGYAREHPELIGAYMQTAALDFGACMLANMLEQTAYAISDVAAEITNEIAADIPERP
jgi:hypothetical protein